MTKPELEQALGRKMHEIGIQQNICNQHNARLQQLQKEANDLDLKLHEIDRAEKTPKQE